MSNLGVFDDRVRWQHRSWVSHRMADGVYLLHVGITVFCGFAWLGPDDWMLWGVVILYGSTEFLWLFRDNYCILTDFERRLRGVPKPESFHDQNFIRRLILLLFRVDMKPAIVITITRSWGRVGFTVAFARLIIPGMS